MSKKLFMTINQNIDASMLASGVLLELNLAGRDLRMALEEIGRNEEKRGGDLEKLKDCKLILTAKIGGCPQDDLSKAGLIADQSYAYEPIEISVLKATRKYFNLPEEMEGN